MWKDLRVVSTMPADNFHDSSAGAEKIDCAVRGGHPEAAIPRQRGRRRQLAKP